jgi:predicted O-linked N-acetylglucosamine transferase (SPINDLY family)
MNRKSRRSTAAQGRRGLRQPAASESARSSDRTAERLAAALRHHKVGRLPEAEKLYRQILAIDPGNVDSLHLLSMIELQTGRGDEAIGHIVKAIAVNDRIPEFHSNLGGAFQMQGRLAEAAACYERALALKPDYAEAYSNLGLVLQQQGKLVEAVACYERALALKPDYFEALSNLGLVLQQQGKLAEAVACYERALALKPDLAEAHTNLGNPLQQQGKLAEAVACFERALALKPDFAEARLALCVAQLPILYMDESEIGTRRAAYQAHLSALCDHVGRRETLHGLAQAVGSTQPFYLAYQGYNDRECQTQYGSLVCRIMADCYPPAVLPRPPEPGQPVRVGIVSAYFWQHTVWKLLIKGWLTQLDRDGFQIFGYHTGTKADGETETAAALCHRFVRGPMSGDRWRQAILDDAPHVLIYPEVGMDPDSARLAAQRLAPVQCNSWGHPDTSGFSTLDYFLSSELMEPPAGQDHYSERLIRLPNLSIYYEPLDTRPVPVERPDFGLRPMASVFWCGQSLFKYLPQFDRVFPDIARGAGDCQFVFIEHPGSAHINDMFRARLDRAFSAFGLSATDYCVLLPRLDQDRFVAAIGQSDIVLDSIGWSGGNSTLETLVHDLPIVTMTGPLMRGRHSMAILRMLAVTETITETIDDYVSTAVRLARDVQWRMAIKTRISENKHRLYRDRTCISALEEFLNGAARRPSAS